MESGGSEVYRVIRKIGAGRFGSVLVVCLLPGTKDETVIALKITGVSSEDSTVHKELQCLRAFRTQAVLKVVHSMGGTLVRELPHDIALYSGLSPSTCLRRRNDHDAYAVIAMEYIPGNTFKHYLEARAMLRSPLTKEELRSVLWQLIIPAAYAYERLGVVHRDIKTSNILIQTVSVEEEGSNGCNWKMTMIDYSSGGKKFSDYDWQAGTPGYMAPERLFFQQKPSWYAHHHTQAHSDIWSIGVVLASAALNAKSLGRLIQVPSLVELWKVLDDNGCFNVRFTDTVYHLLPRSLPWFTELLSKMVISSGLEAEIVEQAIRLILWDYATSDEHKGVPNGERFTGVEETTLYLVLIRNYDAIIAAYEAFGMKVYEFAYERIKSILKRASPELLEFYLISQRWNPEERRKNRRESVSNPFLWAYESLASEKAMKHLRSFRERFDAKDIWETGLQNVSIETLLSGIATDPCRLCAAKSIMSCDQCRKRLCSNSCRLAHNCVKR